MSFPPWIAFVELLKETTKLLSKIVKLENQALNLISTLQSDKVSGSKPADRRKKALPFLAKTSLPTFSGRKGKEKL